MTALPLVLSGFDQRRAQHQKPSGQVFTFLLAFVLEKGLVLLVSLALLSLSKNMTLEKVERESTGKQLFFFPQILAVALATSHESMLFILS